MRKTHLVCLALLLMATVPLFTPVSAEQASPQTFYLVVDNNRPRWRGPVPFWYVAGENITWWNGGMEFIYKPAVAKEKVKTITTELLTMFRELGFITIAGATEPEELHLTYVFDGILEYEGYLFLDHAGRIVIDYIKGGELKVAIYAKATVNKSASSVIYATGGDEEELWNMPTAKVTVPKLPIEILAVPRSGIVEQDMAVGPVKAVVEEKTETTCHLVEHCEVICKGIPPIDCREICWYECEPVEKRVKTYSYVRDELYPIYLGGGPKLTVLQRIGSILNPTGEGVLPHASVRAGGTWWYRQPIYRLVFGESGVEVFKYDLYYGYIYET